MAKSIQQQTGWTRPFPKQILQDPALLVKVTEYDYDLGDRAFLEYFIGRTGILIGCEDNWELAEKLYFDPDWENWLLTTTELFYAETDDAGQYIGPGKTKMVPFGEAREDKVRVYKILKGRLQDAWELYRAERGSND